MKALSEDVAMCKIDFKKECNRGAVSIIIPLTGHFKHVGLSVAKIKENTPEVYEIIFVDCRGSTPKKLRKLVEKGSNYQLIRAGKGVGQTECLNLGIERSVGEYIVILRDPVMVTDGWLTGMLRCINSADNAGVVGPMTGNRQAGIQCMLGAEQAKSARLEEYAREFREKHHYRRIRSRAIAGFLMLFRRSLVEQIGPFDKELEQGSESDDYCLRAALEGYNNVIAGDVFVHWTNASPPKDKRAFEHKWSEIDATSHDGKKLAVLNAMENAEKLYQREDIDKAIVTLIEGIKYCPDEVTLYHRMAEMLIDCERFKEALEALSSISASEGNNTATFELKGYCNAGMQLYEEAAQYADRVLSLKADSAPALNLKGILAWKAGNKAAAEGFFNSSIASDPGYGRAYTNLGILAWEDGFKEKALDQTEKGFILSSTAENSITGYHFVVSEMAEFGRAESIFREAKTLYSQSRRIAFLLIDILLRQERYESAIQEAREAMITFGINDGILSAAQAVFDRFDAQGTKDIDKKPVLSLCMIVKDEEGCLARCLMSAIPVVDEIVIVDTGSKDRTKAIAKAFGAKVYDFEWTNDFSEARNFSLSKTKGEWVLVIDADEMISPLDYEQLRRIVKVPAEHPQAYSITTRNYVWVCVAGWTRNNGRYMDEEEGSGWWPTKKVRLFTNDSRIRYENPVHEFVEPSMIRHGIKISESNIPVHHYGQLDNNHYRDREKKYFALGREKLAAKGADLPTLVQVAVEAGQVGKDDEAVKLWERVLRIEPANTRAFLSLGFNYLKLKRYEDARVSSEKALALEPGLKEAVTLFAACEVLLGNAGKIVTRLEELLKEVPGYPIAQALLAAAYRIGGEKEKSLNLIRSLTKSDLNCADYLYGLSEGLVSTGRTGDAVTLLELAVESGNGTKDVCDFLGELRMNNG